MKNGKTPNARQKQWLSDRGLDPMAWFIVKWNPPNIVLMHRHTGQVRTLD